MRPDTQPRSYCRPAAADTLVTDDSHIPRLAALDKFVRMAHGFENG
ncbi:MAG: hypothetical protein ACI4QT_05720 [Kiritimatiellia bacterium]